MGQLKVRFTIEHQDEQSSFTSLSDLKQHSYSDLILGRLMEFELHLKQAAATAWLQQTYGNDKHHHVNVTMVKEDRSSETSDCMQKA